MAGTGLAAGVGLATYLTLTHQDPLTWYQTLKQSTQQTTQQLTDIRRAKARVATNAQKLTRAIEDGTQTLNAIQTQLDQFQFKVAPRLQTIEATLDHLKDAQS